MFGTRLLHYKGLVIIVDPYCGKNLDVIGVTVFKGSRVMVTARLQRGLYKTPSSFIRRIRRLTYDYMPRSQNK